MPLIPRPLGKRGARSAWRRAAARLRSTHPGIAILLGLIPGQLLGSFPVSFSMLRLVILLAVLGLFLISRRGSLARLAGLWFALGVGSAALPSPANVSLPELTTPVTVRIAEWPRYPSPGLQILTLESADSKTKQRMKASCRAIHLPWRNAHTLIPGDILTIRGKWSTLEDSWNPFSRPAQLRRRGFNARCSVVWSTPPIPQPPGPLTQAQYSWRSTMRGFTGDSELGGLVRAVLLGERDTLSRETETAFRRVGLTHILVISGYQIVLLFGLSQTITSIIMLRFAQSSLISYRTAQRIAVAGALSACTVLTALTGFEPSCQRALIAIVLYVFATSLGRAASAWNTIIATAVVVFTLWPASFLDPGTQLTFAALIGLALGNNPQVPEVGSRSALRSCLLASAATGAISVLWFGAFSPLGFVLNPTLAPLLSALICYGGLTTLGVSLVSEPMASWLMSGLLRWCEAMRQLVWWLAELPWAYYELESAAARISAALILALPVIVTAAKRYVGWLRAYNIGATVVAEY